MFLSYYLVFFKLVFIDVQLIYNVVLVSAVQQSKSAIHIHISTLFQVPFPIRSLQSIEQSSLCYTVGSYYLFYIQQCVYVSPNLPVYPSPTLSSLVTISLFSTSMTLFLFCKQVHLYHFFQLLFSLNSVLMSAQYAIKLMFHNISSEFLDSSKQF